MQVVILAGGKGSRMGALTKELPKPMLPICEKPILEHQIDCLKKYNCTDILLIVNHLFEPIEDYFGDGQKFGVNIQYHLESSPLGTVGGIVEAKDKLKSEFILLYGDVMLDMDFRRLIRFHKNYDGIATLVVHPNDHPFDSDLVSLNQDKKIDAFYPKPREGKSWLRNMVNAGVYVMSKEIINHLEEGKKADFGRDVFPAIYDKVDMYGYNTPEYIKDMGTPERLEKVSADYISGKIGRFNLSNKRKAIFLDRDGVINKDVHLIDNPESFELYDYSASAIKKINESEFLSVVVTNQSVVARNLCTEKELNVIHGKMDTLLGEEGVKIDELYYCPFHPDKGYEGENVAFKKTSDLRKPKSGMLRRAAQELNVDLESSYMIGDSERDIIAGRNAGCITIGVRTGKGLRNAKIQPHFTFRNLADAVSFIMADPYKQVKKDLYKKINAEKTNQPFVIAIAGNSKIGKSTLAADLQLFLETQNLKTRILPLDYWIKDKSERAKTDGVFERFNKAKSEKDVASLLKGGSVSLTPYKDLPTQKGAQITLKGFEKCDVVIVEGVVALSLSELNQHYDYKIFIDIPENELKKRILALYNWKGYSAEDAEALFESRLIDEYSIIKADKSKADLVLNYLDL